MTDAGGDGTQGGGTGQAWSSGEAGLSLKSERSRESRSAHPPASTADRRPQRRLLVRGGVIHYSRALDARDLRTLRGQETRTGGFAGIYGSEDAMWWAAIMVSFAGTFRGVGPQKRTVAQAARNPALADPGANASTSSRSLHGTGTARSRVQRIRGPSDFALTGASGHQTGSGRGRSLAWPSASRARAHPASSACCRACRPGGVSWALVDVVRVMAARSVAFPLRESCFVGSARVGDWLTSS